MYKSHYASIVLGALWLSVVGRDEVGGNRSRASPIDHAQVARLPPGLAVAGSQVTLVNCYRGEALKERQASG